MKKICIAMLLVIVPLAYGQTPKKSKKVKAGEIEHIVGFQRPRPDCIVYRPASHANGVVEWACPVIEKKP